MTTSYRIYTHKFWSQLQRFTAEINELEPFKEEGDAHPSFNFLVTGIGFRFPLAPWALQTCNNFPWVLSGTSRRPWLGRLSRLFDALDFLSCATPKHRRLSSPPYTIQSSIRPVAGPQNLPIPEISSPASSDIHHQAYINCFSWVSTIHVELRVSHSIPCLPVNARVLVVFLPMPDRALARGKIIYPSGSPIKSEELI
ncbi:hypothetical protein BDN72DRAFT_844488 [Pluteus cervinus]|uniref:Uncharacterized protein n=1 Tax=Pluteus cervinus TaxID=181527 RepID=A0ACD3AKC9_9AGAR|nr:hypothetical protein BDN72DRAFT_844488 [Pluteus cervinus]